MCNKSKLNQYAEKIPEKMFKLRTPDRVRVCPHFVHKIEQHRKMLTIYVDCEEYSQGRW